MSRRLAVDPEALARAVMAGIEKATTARWEAAVLRAGALAGDVRPEKIRALSDAFARELGAVGAAAGMAAATPAVGTTLTLLATTTELGWFTARSGDLILTIAALHGRPTPTVEERQAWVLAVLIFGSTARQGFSSLANQMGAQLGVADLGGSRSINAAGNNTARMSIATLRAVNAALSRMLVRRYGSRRGMIALGTALPLGVGAVIGGGANYVAVRNLVKQADRFFAHLPYSSIETASIEVSGAIDV